MKKILALLLAVIMLLSLAACGSKGGDTTATADIPGVVYDENGTIIETAIPEEQRYGGTLNLTWGSFADTFDPHRTTAWVSYNWNCGVYENPISRGANGEFVPCVCDFELSEDLLTLTLWPREGITFHDGTAVEIDDVVASIDRAMRHVSNMKKFFTPLVAEGYPKVEDGKATYVFTEFNVNTLYNFSLFSTWCGVMPKEILEKYGDEYINQPEDCIGTGPYKLVNYQTNALVALEKYEGYIPTTLECGSWGAPKKAYMDKVNIWINPESTSVTMALINGDYDKGELPEEYMAMADQYGLTTSTYASQASMWALGFNTKNPNRPIQDVNLRKAIAAVLDPHAIAAANGQNNYSLELCPVTSKAYYTDLFDNCDYLGEANVELAKEYLAKSNYNGEEIVLVAGGGSAFAILWEDALKSLGINAKIEYMEGTSMTAYITENSNPYDCVTFSYEPKDAAPCQLSVTPREKYWGNERKDELFAEICKYPEGSEESVALWQELAQLWVDDCSVVNLYAFRNIYAVNKDLVYGLEGLPYYYNSYWVNPAEHVN